MAITLNVYPREDFPTIIHLATKNHWRNPSKLEWVISSCIELKEYLELKDIKSVAIPRLGCGLGGLSWLEVRPEIEKIFQDMNCDIVFYNKED